MLLSSRPTRAVTAVAERLVATLKKELVNHPTWPGRLELQSAAFEYIKAFYQPPTRHSTLDMLSPPACEQLESLGWLVETMARTRTINNPTQVPCKAGKIQDQDRRKLRFGCCETRHDAADMRVGNEARNVLDTSEADSEL